MKKTLDKNWAKLILVYNLACIGVSLFFYKLVPTFLCYPPNSIDNDFQMVINGLTYTQQYIMIVLCSLFVENIILIHSLRKTNKIRSELLNAPKKNVTKLYYKLSKTISRIPNLIYAVQIVVPVIMIAITFSLLQGELFITLKVCLLFFSMLTLIASISYIFSKKTFQSILVNIYNEVSGYSNIDSNFNKYVKRSSIKNIIFIVTIPMFIVTAILIALSGYSSIIKETGNLTYDLYNQELNSIEVPTQTTRDVKILFTELLGQIKYNKPNMDSYFIISPNGSTSTSNGEELSIFFTKYMNDLSSTQPEKNRTYDFYGDDSQGVFRKVSINGEEWTIGIRYNLVSNTILIGILSIFAILFIINIILLRYFANYIANDIKRVSNALLKIVEKKNIDHNARLPVVSNDEIGDLVNAFNEIQDLTKNNINQIHNSQNMLIERERLASLGQLIGGIAHNLKTPIMSISGASEGLTDLVKEYDSSIGDKEVTEQDHHDIAKDMTSWIEKIKTYTEYMSDVITAVKGQAVNFSSTTNISFYMDELLKNITILMRHELKNALVSLNITNNVPSTTYLNGDVNCLVQVINNMVSNAIQSYNGKPDQSIELVLNVINNNIVIDVKDHGPGIPKEVQEKLFKEMITTKGKNGTGLGLFISYSTIKAHFNGDIICKSDKNGTTFSIILPLPNNNNSNAKKNK